MDACLRVEGLGFLSFGLGALLSTRLSYPFFRLLIHQSALHLFPPITHRHPEFNEMVLAAGGKRCLCVHACRVCQVNLHAHNKSTPLARCQQTNKKTHPPPSFHPNPPAIDWNLGRFEQGIDKYGYAVIRDPRLMDDKYLEVRRITWVVMSGWLTHS